jgi:hypothetical protein
MKRKRIKTYIKVVLNQTNKNFLIVKKEENSKDKNDTGLSGSISKIK